jgi:hypothetical protein
MEDGTVSLVFRDGASETPIVNALLVILDDQGRTISSLWTGKDGSAFYWLRRCDYQLETLTLQIQLPGYLPLTVSIRNGEKRVLVSLMADLTG